MKKYFLSLDWDYFIDVHTLYSHSYRETERDILVKWYNEYFWGLENGQSIERNYILSPDYERFKEKVVPQLKITGKLPLVVSESHEVAYECVKQSGCEAVYLFDAHSDLGYGGLEALEYEVNCGNWLGKLLKEELIHEAYIIYSPYTKECVEEFEEQMNAFSIHFISETDLLESPITFEAVHLCRSGPWTPPWYDESFYALAEAFKENFNLKVIDQVGEKRRWEPQALTLAERINYKLGLV